jgi:hypothetical protein
MVSLCLESNGSLGIAFPIDLNVAACVTAAGLAAFPENGADY